MASLITGFKLQACLGAIIIEYWNQVCLVFYLIGDWKEGSLYHEYRSMRTLILKTHNNLVIAKAS